MTRKQRAHARGQKDHAARMSSKNIQAKASAEAFQGKNTSAASGATSQPYSRLPDGNSRPAYVQPGCDDKLPTERTPHARVDPNPKPYGTEIGRLDERHGRAHSFWKWVAIHWEKTKPGAKEWLTVAATIVMAASTCLYTYYARRQFGTMERTLDEMRRSGQSTQRPYMVVLEEGWVSGRAPGPNQKVIQKITFKNIGLGAAINVRTYGCLVSFPTATGFDIFYRSIDHMIEILKTNITNRPASLQEDRAPQQISALAVPLNYGVCTMNKAIMDSLMVPEAWERYADSSSSLLSMGGIAYTDSYGNSYETQYCHIIQSNETTLCGSHNTVR